MTRSPIAAFDIGTLEDANNDGVIDVLNEERSTLRSSSVAVARASFVVRALVSAAVIVVIAAGCGGSESTTEPESSIAVVTVSPGGNGTVWVGGTSTFTVRAEDSQGDPVSGVIFAWTSSNGSVATVNVVGVVRGVAEGVATITATAEGHSGTATVAVRVLQLASVDPGTFQTCGLATDGAAFCWGTNFEGLLGAGPTTENCEISFLGDEVPCSTTPVAVSGGLTFASLSVANGFTCGLDTSGTAYCWGVNGGGRLGTGDELDTRFPVAVVGGLTFTSVSAGALHACGLTATGAAYCWGENGSGQLGTTAEACVDVGACSTTPVAVAGGLTFTSLSAAKAGLHTCGVTEAGAAYCWGENESGQLGNGEIAGISPTPVAVSGGLNFVSVSAGGAHTCGVLASGEAYCWGLNGYGQLGLGTAGTDSATPLPVSGGLVFESVSAGGEHTCGVATNGAAYCWGNNFDQQLGDGTAVDQLVPTAVAGGLTFASVSASWFHSCGLTTVGVGYCWGSNEFGQLGDGGTEPSDVPVRVVGQP